MLRMQIIISEKDACLPFSHFDHFNSQKAPIIVLSNSNTVYMFENCAPARDLLGQ